MRVRELTEQDAGAYERLIEADERSMVYATLAWRDFLATAVGGDPLYLVAEDRGCLLGALPSFSHSAVGLGTVVNSLPWFGTHGGCTVSGAAPGDVRGALLEGLVRSFPDDLLSATVVLTPSESDEAESYAALLSATVREPRLGQISELPPDGEDLDLRLEAAVRQKTRNLVRKSLRQGFDRVVTREAWAWDFLIETHSRNLLEMGGRAKPPTHFEALRRTLPPEWLRLSVACHLDAPVAALLLVRFNRTVEYLTPVIEHDARSLQPLSFLIWHELLDAVRDGFRWWNWGGTWASQRSLHHFKAGWGALDRPYAYLVATPPGGLARLRRHLAEAVEAFPYYYLYPYDALR